MIIEDIKTDSTLEFLRMTLNYRIKKTGADKHLNSKPKREMYDELQTIKVLEEKYQLTEDEVILIMVALAPHIIPGFFNFIVSGLIDTLDSFYSFGGTNGNNQKGLLPTGRTGLYAIAGNDEKEGILKMQHFNSDAKLFAAGILSLGPVSHGEPRLSGLLILEPEYLHFILTGEQIKPDLGPSFPAALIKTQLEWDDLVLKKETMAEVLEIQTWLKHNDTILNDWGMAGKIKPGYRVMFYGPPGTGKTMTASLLGKQTGKDVYRIDLSMVVSKYIGETEKNLSSLFNKAQNRDWILFFDEADAIFGKRTNVRDAHDKYANQEVSYLLQRIESYPGLVILASNYKNNIDEAFNRRFSAIVEFKTPGFTERLKLWKQGLPEKIKLGERVSLEELAMDFDITGSNIINVIHFACLKQLDQGSKTLEYDYIIDGIRREYTKEGRMV